MRLFLILIFLVKVIQCARILGVFSLPWYSHYKLGETILKELASRGHEVTVINSLPQKEKVKNYRDITITELNKYLNNFKSDTKLLNFMKLPHHEKIIYCHRTFTKYVEISLQSSNVQDLLHSNETFDLVILQQLFNEAHFGFMHRFKAPVVLIATLSHSLWTGISMGSPIPFSYMPHLYIDYSPKMSFWQRVHNTYALMFHMLYMHFVNLPAHDAILHRYFPDAPPIEDLIYNASLLLVNDHPAFGAALPLQPNIIDIGGSHVQKYRPLEANLKQFLDEANEGVVYFSMGSFFKSTNLPKEKVHEILRAFSKLKMKVLWKWEDDNLPGKPANVRIEKWLSQPAVLAHENVKIFITHGGRLSIIESLYFGKPIIGIPLFAEQGNNVREAEYLGYGLYLSFHDLDEQHLLNALMEMIENPQYTKVAGYRSNVARDLPINPLDNAIHWIEYVIKYKNLPHLKSASLNLKWYQLVLLDVVVFCLAMLWIFKRMLYVFFRYLRMVHWNEKLKIN